MKVVITFPAHKQIAPLVWKGTLWAEDLQLKSPDEIREMLINAGIDKETVENALNALENMANQKPGIIFSPKYTTASGEGFAVIDIEKDGDVVKAEAGNGHYEIALVPLVMVYTPPAQ